MLDQKRGANVAIGMRKRATSHHGVLVIDKPTGMTSHDVVQRIRRLAQTSRVGHAGTLDPMATGVLVVMLGEGTKLGPYLTAEAKRYRASLQLGRGTDTLDADGSTTEEAPLPYFWEHDRVRHVEAAMALERARTEQQPPVFSAIKIDGVTAHSMARRGEVPALIPRPVEVKSLELIATSDDGRIDLELHVSKGYYVRSLARDLGATLGSPAHLTSLRRLASGCFELESAVELPTLLESPTLLQERMIATALAARTAMPCMQLAPESVVRAQQGKRLGDADFVDPLCETRPVAWLSPEGSLVAIGTRDGDCHVVLRGFR